VKLKQIRLCFVYKVQRFQNDGNSQNHSRKKCQAHPQCICARHLSNSLFLSIHENIFDLDSGGAGGSQTVYMSVTSNRCKIIGLHGLSAVVSCACELILVFIVLQLVNVVRDFDVNPLTP
jgi:hypothetical protein